MKWRKIVAILLSVGMIVGTPMDAAAYSATWSTEDVTTVETELTQEVTEGVAQVDEAAVMTVAESSDDGNDVAVQEGETITITSDRGYEMTLTVYPSAEPVYAEVTGFADLGTGTTYTLKIPATVEYNGENIDVTSIAEDVFEYKTQITSVVFGEGSKLTSIGANAFYGCNQLAYIEFPESVTYIGVRAFKHAEKLVTKYTGEGETKVGELVLPSGLTTMGAEAFANCYAVEKVEIPKSVGKIEYNGYTHNGPFYKCFNLTDITFGEGMQTIPDNMFQGNIVPTADDVVNNNYVNLGLEAKTLTIAIPDSIVTIGESAFENNSNLTTVIFGANSKLANINYRAFYGCSELTNFEFPESVTYIGVRAFKHAEKLVTKYTGEGETKVGELVLPSGLTTMGAEAFANCYAVEKVEIPKFVGKIEYNGYTHNGVFYKCFNLTDITFGEGMQTIPNNMFQGNIVPTADDVANKDYVALGLEAKTLAIAIPDSIVTIGESAFESNTNLTTVTFGADSKLTNIDYRAFYGCSELTNFEFPESVTFIGVRAFRYDEKLVTKYTGEGDEKVGELVLPSGLVTMGAEAFANCYAVEKVVIPKSVGKTDYNGYTHNGPFYKCFNLTDITLEDGLSVIPEEMFQGNIVPTAQDLEDYSGLGLEEKTLSLVIPDSVTSIESNAFYNHTNLKECVISETSKLTTVGKEAFCGCTSLESIYLPDGLATLGESAFKNCSELKMVELVTNKLKEIKKTTFSGCSSLTSLEIPYGVTTIAKTAFTGCSAMEKLFVPASVTKMNVLASEFDGATGLVIYVEKGESVAKTFAETNGFACEVGIYVIADEFPDLALAAKIGKKPYDRNEDSRLTLRELDRIKTVDVSNLGIKDMTGTELFTAMESLDCSKNELVQLNTETWTALKNLNCSDNMLADLDLSTNPLETLNCSNNNILVFDLSKVTTLKDVTLGEQTGVLAVKHDTTYDEYILPLKEAYAVFSKTAISDVTDEDVQKPVDDGLVWYEAYGVPDALSYNYTTAFGAGENSATAKVNVTITNAGIVLGDTEYPDAALRDRVQTQADTNANGLISKTEERAFTTLDASAAGIADMTGIARLINLAELNCSNNSLFVLDVSKNTKLTKLNVSENKLSKMDTSANLLLESLEVGSNRLAAVDVSKNTALSTLRGGSQEFSILKEQQDDKVLVNLLAYDSAFDSKQVSKVKVYRGEEAMDLAGTGDGDDYAQLTENGFVVDPEVDKITYQYNVPGFKAMLVTVKPVGELAETEKPISSLRINKFSDKIYTGQETYQNIVIYDGRYMLREGIDYTVTYSNNIEIGTAKVVIAGMNAYYGNYTGTYEIKAEWDITVKNIPNQTYQNKEIKPALTVKAGKQTLVSGVDYEATYLNNVDTGVATVVIKGIGQYADVGIFETNFNIVECNVKKVAFTIDAVTYNGSEQTPAVKADYNGTLVEGVDYIVVYSKNIKAGKGTATITGIGNFTGTVKKTFAINKINLTGLGADEIVVESKVPYDKAGAKAAVVVKCGDYMLKAGTDYTVSYSRNKAIGTGATVTIKGKGSCTGKVTRSFEIVPQDINDESIKVDVAVLQKDKKGKALKAKVTISQGKQKLKENKDYTLQYDAEATKEKGAVALTITGQNTFTGTIQTELIVVDTLISKAKIKGLQKAEYDGTDKVQAAQNILVMLGKNVIPADCYTLSYENNQNAGTAVIKATVVDPKACDYAYGGTATGKFKITAAKFKPSKSSQRVQVSFAESIHTYTGKAQCPEIVVYDTVLGKALKKDVDYKVTYKNNVKVSNKATVTIKGMGNYSGSVKETFSITAKDMSKNAKDFSVIVRHSAFMGKNLKPRVVVMDGNNVLKLNKDYTIKIDQMKNRGKYKFTIEGKGNYCGQLNDEYYVYVY